MISEENYKKLAATMYPMLRDTNTIINCLQAIAEAKKLEAAGEEVPPELKAADNMLKSLSLRISLEKNHEDMCEFLQLILEDLKGDNEADVAELATETTDLLES